MIQKLSTKRFKKLKIPRMKMPDIHHCFIQFHSVSLNMSWKEKIKQYAPYFVDVWQYIVIIIIFILAAIFFL